MPNKTFFWFFLPTGLAMMLFIGLPIISAGTQSFYAQHDQVLKEVKKCDPFGCKISVQIDDSKFFYGFGNSKKNAEHNAAKKLIKNLKIK